MPAQVSGDTWPSMPARWKGRCNCIVRSERYRWNCGPATAFVLAGRCSSGRRSNASPAEEMRAMNVYMPQRGGDIPLPR